MTILSALIANVVVSSHAAWLRTAAQQLAANITGMQSMSLPELAVLQTELAALSLDMDARADTLDPAGAPGGLS